MSRYRILKDQIHEINLKMAEIDAKKISDIVKIESKMIKDPEKVKLSPRTTRRNEIKEWVAKQMAQDKPTETKDNDLKEQIELLEKKKKEINDILEKERNERIKKHASLKNKLIDMRNKTISGVIMSNLETNSQVNDMALDRDDNLNDDDVPQLI